MAECRLYTVTDDTGCSRLKWLDGEVTDDHVPADRSAFRWRIRDVRFNGPIGSAVRLGIAVIAGRTNKNGASVSPMRKSAVASSRDVGVVAVRGSESLVIFINFDWRAVVIINGICEADK